MGGLHVHVPTADAKAALGSRTPRPSTEGLRPCRPQKHEETRQTEAALTKKSTKVLRPTAQPGACRRCGTPSPADADRCPHCRSFLPGNVASLTHGLRSDRARNALLPGQEDQLAVLGELTNELLSDLGGSEAVGVVKRNLAMRFVQLTVIADTLADNLVRNGILTPKGKQRAALTVYLLVVDRLARLATPLGLERHVKRVPSIQDFLAQRHQHPNTPEGA